MPCRPSYGSAVTSPGRSWSCVTPTPYRRDMNTTAALLAAVEIGDPLTRGSLALFPLFHELPPTGRYLSGPRAEALLAVTEVDGGVVPVLDVYNDSELPVLLVDGETLLGARQNRIVTTSVLLAAKAKTRVAVTCVEA